MRCYRSRMKRSPPPPSEHTSPVSSADANEAFLKEVDVRVPNLVVVTADHSDSRVHGSVQEVLQLLRDVKGVDVVFVADMTECGRHLAYGAAADDPEVHLSSSTDSLEALWGERVVEGRVQHPAAAPDGKSAAGAGAGRHIHSRIVSGTGKVYGMLCCIAPDESDGGFRIDQRMLRHTAALTAAKIERSLAKQP